MKNFSVAREKGLTLNKQTSTINTLFTIESMKYGRHRMSYLKFKTIVKTVQKYKGYICTLIACTACSNNSENPLD